MLFVVFEIAFIGYAILDQFSVSISSPIDKISFICTSFCPCIYAFSIWFSFLILSFISIAICKDLGPLSFLQKVDEHSPISTESMLKDSFALLPIINPISIVVVALRRFPFPMTIFHAVFPIAFKKFTIIPLESSIVIS